MNDIICVMGMYGCKPKFSAVMTFSHLFLSSLFDAIMSYLHTARSLGVKSGWLTVSPSVPEVVSDMERDSGLPSVSFSDR